MIWMFFFFTIYLVMNLKENFFINSIMVLDYSSIVMGSILPLTMMIIFMFKFNYESKLTQEMYMFMFLIIFLMIQFSFIVSDSFLFILSVELCVYPMSYLILNFSKDRDKTSAMIFMFSINIMGSIPFMMYLIFLLNKMDFSILTLPYTVEYVSNSMNYFFYILMLISKIPTFMFHFWLTKAHVAASGSCSMILASLMLKLGTYGLFKFGLIFLLVSQKFFNTQVSIVLLGYGLLSLIMIRMFDTKYLIACSSILHMSLIFPFLSYFNYEAAISSLFMMVGHGLISYFLFYLISIVYEKSLSRTLELSKSMESINKTTSMIIFFFMFLNLGVPPFISFYSEFLFMKVLVSMSIYMSFSLAVLMIISVLFLMFYLTKMIFGKKHFHQQKNMNFSFLMKSIVITLSLMILMIFN